MKHRLDAVHVPGLPKSFSWERKLIGCDNIQYVLECDSQSIQADGLQYICAADEMQFQTGCFKDNVHLVGSGAYGSVYLAKMAGQTVVIKLFLRDWSRLPTVVLEAGILSHLKGTGCTPQFIGLVGLEQSEDFLRCGLVMQYIGDEGIVSQSSNLFDVYWDDCIAYDNHNDMIIPRREWLGLCYRLTQAVKKIHVRNVIQNDLKIDNVLLRREEGKWMPFVIDFGLSVMKGAADEIYMPAGAECKQHVAPEIYTGANASVKSDIYSLGQILDILSKAFDLNLNDLVRKCTNIVPERRPTADRLSNMLRERMMRVSSLNCGLRPRWS
jgi:serine/threonine protein kinase